MPENADLAADDPFQKAANAHRELIQAKTEAYEQERDSRPFRQEIQTLDKLTSDFAMALRIAWFAFTRYPESDKWLLQRATDDLLESAISIALLAREGV